ncbi:hypothetical protein [Nocardia sp. BMG111209]|uniref:hypothetical protein n=1 Tax=Nocardia sp. BMG111209 TaxID=1160137 RepID=UPI000369F04D|nr:hypothetical protein [Nocardia sp. BMG111209]
MCDKFERLAVGDEIAWWEGEYGRGAAPHQTGAERLTGVVAVLHRNRAGRVVAAFVDCRATIGGAFNVTIRPDLGHQPEPARSG